MLIAINVADRSQPAVVAVDIAPVAEGSTRIGVCVGSTDTGTDSGTRTVHIAAPAAEPAREHPPADQLVPSSGARSSAPLVLVSIGLFACAVVLATALLELGL